MNETSQTIDGGRKRQARHVPGVDALEHRDAVVRAQSRMKLAVADVERDHPRRTVLQQAIREASRRGPDVEAILARGVEREQLEGVRELLAAPRDESWRPLDLEHDRLVELRARLVVARNEPGDDECLRLAAGLREAALHEQDIEPLLHSRGRLAGCGRSES